MRRRAVFLDAGWTLIHPARSLWEILADVARAAGHIMSASECEAQVHALWRHAQESAAAELHPDAEYPDSDEAFAALFRQLAQVAYASAGVSDPHEELVGRFVRAVGSEDLWRVFADAPGALRELRARGYALVVVSNAASDLPAFLGRLGLAPLFDGILASAAEGWKKPDRRLFQRALEVAGVEPEDAVHLGDLGVEDVLGARNAGLRPMLIHRGSAAMFPSFPPLLPRAADAVPVVPDLGALLAALA
jgi:putative hydrolase of the HAD superfamily